MTQYVDRHQCDGEEDFMRALEEAIELADYLQDQYAELRTVELDIQHSREGGKDGRVCESK